MYVFELGQDLWNNSNQEVNSFPVCKPRDKYNVDLVRIARFFNILLPNGGIRSELIRVYCIWNGKCFPGIKLCPEHEIVLTGMTNANRCIKIPEAPFDQFIQVNASEVVVAEKRMFSEHSFEAHRFSSHQNYVLEDADALMAMDDFNLLADQDLPN